MINIDLLIFDLDGTLVDSKNGIVNAVNFTLRELGLEERPPEEIASFIGTGVNSLIRKALGERNKKLFAQGVMIFEDYYLKHSAQRSRLYPHAEEILKHFKDKLIFVVTNRKSEMALVTLNNLGIGKYFKDIIGGDDESCLKPSLCSLNKALKWSRDKQKSMIIGDMDLDILAGKKAGIYTCGVTYGIGNLSDLLNSEPDYLISDLQKLKKIVK